MPMIADPILTDSKRIGRYGNSAKLFIAYVMLAVFKRRDRIRMERTDANVTRVAIAHKDDVTPPIEFPNSCISYGLLEAFLAEHSSLPSFNSYCNMLFFELDTSLVLAFYPTPGDETVELELWYHEHAISRAGENIRNYQGDGIFS